MTAAAARHTAAQQKADDELLIARNDVKRLMDKLDSAEAELRKLHAGAADQVRARRRYAFMLTLYAMHGAMLRHAVGTHLKPIVQYVRI